MARKKRVVIPNRCYHLVSRVAHRAFFFNDDEKTFSDGGWYTAEAVPKPTSGLFLLLGMAGLALRRRRA